MIALFPNEKKDRSFEMALQIRTFFEQRGIQTAAEDEKAALFGAVPLSIVDKKDILFLISMGGDGTLLRISHQFSHWQIPILGINLGHLGFMADIPSSDIFSSLEDLLRRAYTIEERLALEASSSSSGELLRAVNDIVFHRAKNQSLIELSIHADNILINTFVADGIIIATPTGSTAYSLAAGGPILAPTLDAVVITPICAHTISNRPIVITAHRTIRVEYHSPYDPIDVRADGLKSLSLAQGEAVSIRRSQHPFRIVHLHRHEYFATLRQKLNWSGKLIQ